MDVHSTQVGWTDAQWEQVQQAVAEASGRGGIAGSFLPCFGPLATSAEVVRAERLVEQDPSQDGAHAPLRVDDVAVHDLWTLTVHVSLKQQQIAEENLSGALLAFRRAANLVARAEDAITFNGAGKPGDPIQGVPSQVRVSGNEKRPIVGLVEAGRHLAPVGFPKGTVGPPCEENIVKAVAGAVTALERDGHLGPFACVLGDQAYVVAYTPNHGSLVLPSDRMEPMLGMPLLRSGTMPKGDGIVVALAGNPIDLVVATAPSAQFLNVNDQARRIFRVYERFVLRIKEDRSVSGFRLAGCDPKN